MSAESPRVCLVTGASSVLGAEIALQFADPRTRMILVARGVEGLERVAARLRASGCEAEILSVDLEDREALSRACDRLEASGLTPDLLVNCAGVGGIGPARDLGLDRQLRMVRLNIEALTYLTLRFLPAMIGRGGGRIVNVSSSAAFQPCPGVAVYAATKAFVNSFSEALDFELQGTGVRVVAICPGPVSSEQELRASRSRPGWLRGARTLPVERVVRELRAGLNRERRIIVPGAMNRALAFVGRHLSRRLVLPRIARIMHGSAARRGEVEAGR